VPEPIESLSIMVSHSKADHRRSLRSSRRAVLWRIRIVGVLVVLASLPAIALGEEYVWLGGMVLLVLGGALVARSLLLPGAIVRRLPASAFVPHRLEISSVGVRQSTDTAAVELTWAEFREATRDRHHWVLRHKVDGPPTNISRRHLTADQDERLGALLKELGLLA